MAEEALPTTIEIGSKGQAVIVAVVQGFVYVKVVVALVRHVLVCPAKNAQTVIRYALASAVLDEAAKTTDVVVN